MRTLISIDQYNKSMEIRVGRLRYRAMKYYESTIPEDEIRKEDITKELFLEIKDRIKNKNLINMQINGNVTTGKSTLGIYFVQHILTLLDKSLSIQNITGDQVEFLRVIKNPKITNTALLIDEWNELGETGLNSTTDKSLFQYYSDVQAQRYIHKVSCAPKEFVDPNSDIILDIVSADKVRKVTHFLISFRFSKAEGEVIQLIGRGTINVSEILTNEVYNKYRDKKFRKMELVYSHGIRDVREIEQADIIVRVWKEMKNLANLMVVDRGVISNYVDKVRREKSELLSLLSVEDIIRKIHGLMQLERTIATTQIRISAHIKQGKPTLEMEKALEQLEQVKGALLSNYIQLIEVGKRYKEI